MGATVPPPSDGAARLPGVARLRTEFWVGYLILLALCAGGLYLVEKRDFHAATHNAERIEHTQDALREQAHLNCLDTRRNLRIINERGHAVAHVLDLVMALNADSDPRFRSAIRDARQASARQVPLPICPPGKALRPR